MIKSDDLASPGSRHSSGFQQLHMALGNQESRLQVRVCEKYRSKSAQVRGLFAI